MEDNFYIGEGIIPHIKANNCRNFKEFTMEDFEKAIKDLCTDDGNRSTTIQLVKEKRNKKGELVSINTGAWITCNWNIKNGYPSKDISDKIKEAHEMGYKLPEECDWYMKGLEMWAKKVELI